MQSLHFMLLYHPLFTVSLFMSITESFFASTLLLLILWSNCKADIMVIKILNQFPILRENSDCASGTHSHLDKHTFSPGLMTRRAIVCNCVFWGRKKEMSVLSSFDLLHAVSCVVADTPMPLRWKKKLSKKWCFLKFIYFFFCQGA